MSIQSTVVVVDETVEVDVDDVVEDMVLVEDTVALVLNMESANQRHFAGIILSHAFSTLQELGDGENSWAMEKTKDRDDKCLAMVSCHVSMLASADASSSS